MISPQDLRIGNLIWHTVNNIDTDAMEDVITTVDGNLIKSLELHPHLSYNPIPLTEEWLTKLSFEGVYKRRFKHVEDTVLTMYFQNGQFTIQDYDWFELKMPHIKYVHQLQNLYWCLCGKELELVVQ